MKIHNVLDEIIDLLDELEISGQAVVVERASHPTGHVYREMDRLRGQSIHYLSLMIVHSRRLADEN
jgi:precorrin-2 methylase